MKNIQQDDILSCKEVVDGLFGYTAYYYKGNKIDEGKTYDATVLGQTAVLFGEKYGLKKIEKQDELKEA
ncbi:MAG: hypothetical protein K6E76_02585 [Patescibacteria group bacterium]|nr:hypothetical protein [Patescibacteria group bacterium]